MHRDSGGDWPGDLRESSGVLEALGILLDGFLYVSYRTCDQVELRGGSLSTERRIQTRTVTKIPPKLL